MYPARDRITGAHVELVEIGFPYCGGNPSALEARAIASMAAAVGLDVDGVAGWHFVGEDAEGAYAVRHASRGMSLRELWSETARRSPHAIEYAWMDPGSMADAYVHYTLDPTSGAVTESRRRGPWRVDDAVPELVSRGRHRPLRVEKAPVDVSTTLGLVRAIASTLHALHARGLAHTNLQPQSVLVHEQGMTLEDIGTGLAEWRGSMYMGSGSSNYESSYFTPELLSSDQSPDPRSDVFAVGVLLWELLAYGGAFMRATSMETIEAVLEDRLPPISSLRREVPPDLDDLIVGATQKEPRDRVAIDAFLDAIPELPVPIPSMLAALERPVVHERLIAL